MGALSRLMAWISSWQSKLPTLCAICGKWSASAFCSVCVAQHVKRQLRCRRCAIVLSTCLHDQDLCAACLSSTSLLDHCTVLVDYADPWRSVMTQFKYTKHPMMAAALADVMCTSAHVQQALEWGEVVLPIPSSNARLRERGYHQTWLLAKRLSDAAIGDELLQRASSPQRRSLIYPGENALSICAEFLKYLIDIAIALPTNEYS